MRSAQCQGFLLDMIFLGFGQARSVNLTFTFDRCCLISYDIESTKYNSTALEILTYYITLAILLNPNPNPRVC